MPGSFSNRWLVPLCLVAACLVVVSSCSDSSSDAGPPLQLKVLAFNDFHGNLVPSSFRIPDPANPTATLTIQAGGIEHLATVIKEARAQNPNTLVIGAGDFIGATPLISSLLRDEPTIDALSKMGVDVSALGNHEFDRGKDELLRFQNGGCNSNEPDKACKYESTFAGAKYQYVAANVIDKSTGRPLFPPYVIKNVDGVPVAITGAVLKGTPSIVTPSGVAGLEFRDEAESINALIAEIKSRGAQTIIATFHEGGTTSDSFDKVDCATLSGPIVDITRKLDKAIDVVISGHTHRGYQCRVDGRLVTQAASFGYLMTEISLTIDRGSKDVTAATSRNLVIDSAKIAKDPAMTAIVQRAKSLTDPVANQTVASLAVEQITRDTTPAGESSLGDVIADAQLAATKPAAKGGAQIAFMNPGGIRANLPPNTPNPSKLVTFGDVFTVQPFGNTLVVMDLSGAQLKTLLEQQWQGQTSARILQVSDGFKYSWDASRPVGDRVVASSMTLNGEAIDAARTYRVSVNSFLADGGDNFVVLREGKNRLGGDLDLDAMTAYLKAQQAAGTPVGTTPRNRITAINLQSAQLDVLLLQAKIARHNLSQNDATHVCLDHE